MKSSLAAVLLILQGVINLLTSAIFLAIPNMTLSFVEGVPSFVLSFLTLFSGAFAVMGILQIVAGAGVLTGASWSWGLGIGVSILGLFNIPIGTVLAIICLIILLSSREEFDVEKGENKEWPLILGTMLVVAGALWVLGAYVETPYAWALAFGIIGIALMILDRALKTETKGLEILGEISLGIGVFLALFVSNIRIEYLAAPIIVSGLLIIVAYYISRRNRGAGKIIAVLCIAAVLGSVCSPLYQIEWGEDQMSIEWNEVWIGNELIVSEISETKYFEPKERVSINNVNGGITIKGWDENRIKLDYTKRASSESLLNDIEINITESDDELVVATERPGASGWVAVEYKIMVPESTSEVILKTSNGEIAIEGLSKVRILEAENINDRIYVKEVDGEYAKLHITNDEVEVEASRFQNLSADTVNGDLEFALKRIGNITLETTNGAISISSPDYSNVTIHAVTSNGEIELDDDIPVVIDETSRDRLIAHAGSPTYRIDIKTINGDIDIES
ncbi:MAG: DUF4097 family beta strand repeat-containing protein [Candidatus Thermoplasmatota archaeon]|nr:DUF4097 family beta strand repeat-containing protein [Candidatus Thermoplasmatota archaeon]